MSRIVEIMPNDNRKSFYGKAFAILEGDGRILLQSYSTIVGEITVSGEFIRHWWGYSATTMRHVNAFLATFGVAGGGKAWWDAQPVKPV